MKVAIYTRVSGKSNRQDAANQSLQLIEYRQRQGWEYVEYTDRMSGTRADRPDYQRLFADARLKHFDMVLFWALDRFSREGTLKTLEYLQRLDSYVLRGRVSRSNISTAQECFATLSSRFWPRLPSRNMRGCRSALSLDFGGRSAKARCSAQAPVRRSAPGMQPVNPSERLPPTLACLNLWLPTSRSFRTLSPKPLSTTEDASLIQ